MPRDHQGHATEPTKSAMDQDRRLAGSGAGLVGGALAAWGSGMPTTVRPDPSILGAVGERGSRYESCLQLGDHTRTKRTLRENAGACLLPPTVMRQEPRVLPYTAQGATPTSRHNPPYWLFLQDMQRCSFLAGTADRRPQDRCPTGRAVRAIRGGRCSCGPGPHNWLDASSPITITSRPFSLPCLPRRVVRHVRAKFFPVCSLAGVAGGEGVAEEVAL
jgi:hypothetical protein